jgi:hypothetical protein
VWAAHHGDAPTASTRLEHVRDEENRSGLRSPDAYSHFTARVERCRDAFRTFLSDAKAARQQVAAYGAAAKGNTFLNYCGVTADDIAFVVDRSPYKQGHLLPGSRVPIEPPEHVAKAKPHFLVILPWNLRDEIADQMGGIRDWGGQFVVAVPEVERFG